VTKVGVLNDYQGVASSMADWSEAMALAEVDFLDEVYRDEDHAAEALADYDVLCLMRERLPFPASQFEKLPNLRCLVTAGEFNRAVDLEAASRHGVLVSGTSNGIGRLVTAELTWGLIIAAARNIIVEDRAVQAGVWQTKVGFALHGKTLGIIGLGGVGRYLARYGHAFDMDVIAWSRNLTEEKALEDQVRRVDKEELLRRSDIVSVNMVLSDATKGLIDAEALALMKPTAILVNTSRGPLVDEGALVEALREERIGGAVLDVYDKEPLAGDHALREFPDRVILSPHMGYVTREVYEEFYGETARSLSSYLRGEPIRVLNPDATAAAP
jgi:phosphoglycerate dehydrogenase-like enzyme